MSKMLFVGEKRSPKAIEMGVTWKDGRLAAKHLFEALRRLNIDIAKCDFKNVYQEILEENIVNKDAVEEIKQFNGIVVAMGRKVERVLKNHFIEHEFIYHPATRGTVRNIDNYCIHVKENLCHLWE